MLPEWKARLLNEAQELAEKYNKLNDFMRTEKFIQLSRKEKDLLYDQVRAMNDYLQVLSKRLEFYGVRFTLN